ncbi:DMT family transporter [Desulfobulbus alkaliphilus]|uniref:DMT family transporter n=1 Tax=Desulfobulbus alkaliphilus TaxID=869814 RepID=UPI00196589DF|nr:DMT family transporter [Desulfobulbus alkaliphilus]MBM9536630.1 DMT family transporter [Desulfobulbus alkaliphilus]
MSRHTKACLFTLLTILFWSTAASAFKIALGHVSPYTLLIYSVATSTLVLLLILVLQGKLGSLWDVSGPVLGKALLLGILNPFLYYVVLFAAYARLPGQVAMSLNYAWPLVLTLLSVPILGQSLNRGQLIAVAVSFFGAIIIATQGQFIHFGDFNPLGLILAAGSTLIWASFWLFNARDGLDPVLKLFLGFCSGLLCTLLCSPLFGGIVWPPAAAWPVLIYIGLFEMGLTFVLWLHALQLATTAARVGNLIYLTPFFSLLLLRLIIGEQIHITTFVGLLFIVGSIVSQELWGKHVEQKP